MRCLPYRALGRASSPQPEEVVRTVIMTFNDIHQRGQNTGTGSVSLEAFSMVPNYVEPSCLHIKGEKWIFQLCDFNPILAEPRIFGNVGPRAASFQNYRALATQFRGHWSLSGPA